MRTNIYVRRLSGRISHPLSHCRMKNGELKMVSSSHEGFARKRALQHCIEVPEPKRSSPLGRLIPLAPVAVSWARL